jgi:hypothetical protein
VTIILLTISGIAAYGPAVWFARRILHYMPKARHGAV